jgi:protein-S-isoprenylcysteine O-methyltransferase Ste14
MDKIAGPIITACWIIFIVYWIIGAVRVKTTAEHQSLPSALAHRLPVAFGYWLMIYSHLPPPMNLLLIPHTDLTLAAAAVVCVLGLLICLWARRTLAGNWSSDVTFKQGHELVRTGPYRYVRHPIYTGLLTMSIGTAVAAGRLHSWLGVIVVTIGFGIKMSQEERLMMRHFPEAYPLYRGQVKALIPWIF